MSDILASFLLPSRNRVPRLQLSIDSLRSTATDPQCYEVLVRADNDDTLTIDTLANVLDPRVRLFMGDRGRGYLDLHLMINSLAAQARGEFLFLWNDDALMMTPRWDVVMKSHLADKPRIYHPASHGTTRNIFPIVRRSVYEAMGRFSESALNDFYMWTVAKRCNINTPIAIHVKHDHPRVGGTNLDQTYLDAAAACGIVKNDDKDPRIMACLDEDVAKVQVLLSK